MTAAIPERSADPHPPVAADPAVAAAVTDALEAAQVAADDLLLHLQLALAASYGPTAIIDAAMADVTMRAEALARADAVCRRYTAPTLGDAGPRLRGTVEAVERQARELALELARRRADIDEVLRHAAGSPGTYDALGRTTPNAARRPRGTG